MVEIDNRGGGRGVRRRVRRGGGVDRVEWGIRRVLKG